MDSTIVPFIDCFVSFPTNVGTWRSTRLRFCDQLMQKLRFSFTFSMMRGTGLKNDEDRRGLSKSCIFYTSPVDSDVIFPFIFGRFGANCSKTKFWTIYLFQL